MKLTRIKNNFHSAQIRDDLTVYFSYETMIGFKVDGQFPTVRENVWGPTTGKHLNYIDGGDKSSRVDKTEFNRLYEFEIQRVSV